MEIVALSVRIYIKLKNNKKGGKAVAQSLQHVSLAQTQGEDMDISFSCYQAVKDAKKNTRENLHLLVSVFDRINNLCTVLERLDYVMEKNLRGLNGYSKEKEK